MHRMVMFVRKDTDAVDGIMSTCVEHLEDIDYDRVNLEMVVIDPDHPVRREQLAWTCPRREVFGALWDRQLSRKPQALIDAEEMERMARQQPTGKSLAEVLLNLINEERAVSGKAALTMDEVRALQTMERP